MVAEPVPGAESAARFRPRNPTTPKRLRRRPEVFISVNDPDERSAHSESAPQPAGENQARSQFLAGMYHDMRGSLHQILGYSELLIAGAKDGRQAAFLPDFHKLHSAGQQLLSHITSVFGTAHISTPIVDSARLRLDLRLPLEQLIGYSELLQREAMAGSQPDFIPDLQKIDSAARQLQVLISASLVSLEMADKQQIEAPEAGPGPESAELLGQTAEKAEWGYLLVVDDYESNRDLLSRWLKQEGYSVHAAQDGQTALDHIGNEKFDLVLLDIMLPDLDGLELLSLIRRTHPITELPVILVTGLGSSENIVEGLRRGANDYVIKPIDYAALLARVRTQLRLKRLVRLKDEFLQIASHDLKNPLSIILMSVGLAQQEDVPENMKDLLTTIERRGLQMERIITDFLDFQAAEDGKLSLTLKALNLNGIAREVAENNMEYARGKDISLSTALSLDLPRVRGDVVRLTQVAQNLVNNAIKFCPARAEVVILTRHEAGLVVFEVRDSGPGLTEEDLRKVFTKFARLSNKPTSNESSTGLGLAICKQLIELQGGRIGVHNNPEGGATFWFSLPAV